MKHAFTLIIIFLLSWTLQGQQIEDQGSVEMNMDQIKFLSLYNHNGDIKVKAIKGNKGKIKYKRKLKSASKSKLEEADSQIFLDSINYDGGVIYFVNAPDRVFEIDADGKGHYNYKWNDWKDNKRFRVEYEFEFDVELPAETALNVFNHHSGLQVSGITGPLYAQNHHKDIILDQVGSDVSAETHHGDIEINFMMNPQEDAHFHTHHGDIKVRFSGNLNAEVSLKSHHGAFFSDFDWEYRPVPANVNQSNEKGTRYKIGKGTAVRIGNGGPSLDFRTHHGDIYLLNN